MGKLVYLYLIFSVFISGSSLWAKSALNTDSSFTQELKKLREEQFQNQVDEGLDAFYDSEQDYSRFSARVTDKDDAGTILKVTSENRNIRFFRAGDLLEFRLASKEDVTPCQAHIRGVEKDHFVMFVKDLTPCFNRNAYFRRGTILIIDSKVLAERVEQASRYRVVLLKRRRDFFEQLNETNKFVWGYDQKRVEVASDYDRKIQELRAAKEKALVQLIDKKKKQVRLQRELSQKLDELDRDLDFYRVRKDQLLVDRWHLDHDLGLPVGERPQELRAKKGVRDADEIQSRVKRLND